MNLDTECVLSHPSREQENHEFFLTCHLNNLNKRYASLEANRCTVLHFAVNGLDILGKLRMATESSEAQKEQREQIITWVYSLQVPSGGFMGSPVLLVASTDVEPSITSHASLAATYSALCILFALNDDLSRVHVLPLLDYMKSLQVRDITTGKAGAFYSSMIKDEADTRYTYCACVIPWILACKRFIVPASFDAYICDNLQSINTTMHSLPQFEQINGDIKEMSYRRYATAVYLHYTHDIPLTTKFLLSCNSWDGAFSLHPSCEGHGGATYTAVASLYLLGSVLSTQVANKLTRWVVMRQDRGFSGRINKSRDCCYSFWVGALNQVLGTKALVDDSNNILRNQEFINTCEGDHSGFSKDPDCHEEIVHTFYAIAGMSLLQQLAPQKVAVKPEWALSPIDCQLGMTQRATGIKSWKPMLDISQDGSDK